MSRFVWPYLFTLRAGNLIAASKNRNLAPIRDKFFPSSNGNTAIALRWSCASILGFPREPFQVFRRLRNTIENTAAVTVLANATAVTGQAQTIPVLAGGDAAYIVYAAVSVAASGSVGVQALDVNRKPIPNQSLVQTTSGPIEFRCPGIAALSVSGSGTIGPIEAVGETAYANLPDWAEIQTVGLPLANNEIDASYRTKPQGFWSTPLTPPVLDGVAAATARTLITAELEVAPPASGIADLPLPVWAQPNATAYIDSIRSAGNIVQMVEHCLQNSDDTNALKMQSNYTETVTTDGLSQIGATSPGTQTSNVTLPVTAVAMLAVSTDPYASVSLGYGTLDIPPATNSGKITVAIAPTSAVAAPGRTEQFTATLTGENNATVIWSVNGVPGGNSIVGTISKAGLYTAPASVPANHVVVVTVTSAQDPTASDKAAVTISQVIPVPTSTPAPVAATPEVFLRPPTLPQADNYGEYDYMVTAPFVFPFGLTLTLAALSMGQPPVETPAGLASSASQVNAPLARDQGAPAVVRITWAAPENPQGYGIVASRAPNQSQFLNAARPAAVGGFDVFVGLPPLNPDPDTPPDLQNPAFSDVEAALPLAAPAMNNRYLVAAQDIFGQWSNWVETDTVLPPAAVTKPALIDATFLYAASIAEPPSPVIPASLRIDFGWNWEDRAPGQIRFTGQFVPAPVNSLNPPFLGGFATKNSGPIGPPVVLTFAYTGVNPDTVSPTQVIPTITSGHASNGPVTTLAGPPASPPANPNQMRYRVELTGIQLDFSASNEIDFLLYATATEEVQPGVWSDATDQPTSNTSPAPPPLLIGKIVRSFDPNPPTVTFTPPVISWTALPDATGTARGVLEWEADPTASGYFVWEATESALLHILPPGSPGGTPEPPADTPYATRANTLKSLVTAWQDQSLQGFARLTQDPISDHRTEIALPGSASTLYAFRISAIGNNNVESGRSPEVAIFGVPRRNVPGTPRLLLRSNAGSPPGLQVIVLPVASSAPSAGFRLFRVRSQALSQNASSMGPAKIDEFSPLWEDYASVTLAGNLLQGKAVLDPAAIPSWYPYYYRATAVGAQDLANGLYSGESPYSSVQPAEVLPAGPPMIASFHLQVIPLSKVAIVSLTTDLPAAAASPVGPALVELLQLVPPSPAGPLVQNRILSIAPDQIPVGVIVPPPIHPPLSVHRMVRTAPDGNEHWTLSLLVSYTNAEAGSFILRLTDPLARQSTVSF
jgi:hypothetical protein